MRRSTRSRVAWASWMTGGGVAISVVVWLLTGSVGWALAAFVASGPVLNAAGQMVVRPAQAVVRAGRHRDKPGPRESVVTKGRREYRGSESQGDVSHAATIEGEIIINRPIEEVFDFVADERNEPRFNPHMRRAEKVGDGPIGVGTHFVPRSRVRPNRPDGCRVHGIPAPSTTGLRHPHVGHGCTWGSHVRFLAGRDPDALVLGGTAARDAQTDARHGHGDRTPSGTSDLDGSQASPRGPRDSFGSPIGVRR